MMPPYKFRFFSSLAQGELTLQISRLAPGIRNEEEQDGYKDARGTADEVSRPPAVVQDVGRSYIVALYEIKPLHYSDQVNDLGRVVLYRIVPFDHPDQVYAEY